MCMYVRNKFKSMIDSSLIQPSHTVLFDTREKIYIIIIYNNLTAYDNVFVIH